MTTIRRVLAAATLVFVAVAMTGCKDENKPTDATPQGEHTLGKEKGKRTLPKPPPIEPAK